jgi:hypothetical protein
MTYSSARRPGAPSIRPAAATHLFALGQIVRPRRNFGTFQGTAGTYRITGILPPRGGSPQYRIRNEDERHERVTTQDSLEAVLNSQSSEGATLIERTFGHGQGTETEQPRNQEAKAGESAAQA